MLVVMWFVGMAWLVWSDSLGLGADEDRTSPKAARKKKDTVVVGVFPSTVDRDRHTQRIDTIQRTWGSGMKLGFLGQTDFTPPANMTNLHTGASEVIKFMIEASLEKYPDLQWWVKADDLTFIIPSNLELFLEGRDPNDVQLLGRRLRMPGGEIFCSGGAGYVLSRGALKHILTNWEKCKGSGWFAKEGGDIAFAQCLPKEAIIDTRDESGAERFSAYNPQRTMSGAVDNWYREYTPWYSIPKGLACCSPNIITFHYVEYGEAHALHTIFIHKKEYLEKSDTLRLAIWPKNPPQRSGYSTMPTSNDPMWDLLLKHIKT
eukprot:TRINITY_DN2253_c6_g1_i1.p1 TRINITY_DN2253_c6_g1~~TRINITY_DN2253_c6_g1_i1.p1  ORF type:complete len:338 (+),score=52.45 TRINITY_DN2253_c6_g1_i1:61-1014(+)